MLLDQLGGKRQLADIAGCSQEEMTILRNTRLPEPTMLSGAAGIANWLTCSQLAEGGRFAEVVVSDIDANTQCGVCP